MDHLDCLSSADVKCMLWYQDLMDLEVLFLKPSLDNFGSLGGCIILLETGHLKILLP